MKSHNRFVLTLVLIWAAFLTPCFYYGRHAVHGIHHYDGITILGDIKISEPWREETARRFPTALVYASHGANCGGKWICQNPDFPDSLEDAFYVHDLALSLRQQYPDRVIVLVICNPGHLHVGVPGVFYANDDVLIDPDLQNHRAWLLHILHPGCVGNIFEFHEDAL